jgi:hypothetical protein
VCSRSAALLFPRWKLFFFIFWGFLAFGGVGRGKLLGVKFQLYWANWAWLLDASSLELFRHFTPNLPVSVVEILQHIIPYIF